MSNVRYTVYEAETGIILRTGECPFDMIQVQSRAPNEIVLEGFYPNNKYYVVDHEAIERPTILTDSLVTVPADGHATFSFTTPVGTVVRYMGEHTLLDGSFSFATAEPGNYYFGFTPPFPYQDHFLEIEAV